MKQLLLNNACPAQAERTHSMTNVIKSADVKAINSVNASENQQALFTNRPFWSKITLTIVLGDRKETNGNIR
jgi:hypothetical protein